MRLFELLVPNILFVFNDNFFFVIWIVSYYMGRTVVIRAHLFSSHPNIACSLAPTHIKPNSDVAERNIHWSSDIKHSKVNHNCINSIIQLWGRSSHLEALFHRGKTATPYFVEFCRLCHLISSKLCSILIGRCRKKNLRCRVAVILKYQRLRPINWIETFNGFRAKCQINPV